jgi:DNA invertase Pin-like site-specific DNA recombinase
MSEKVQSIHLERKAVVYIRQSSLKQVREHRESTARQYALRERALKLGWSAEAIEMVDEDLGLSGSTSEGRGGFQRLAEDIAQGHVGGLFALEVSRLARSSADWHRLLELAGLADVVIGDEDSVYNPRDHNDRLLLGLKGQFADAELSWMRLRLQGGKLNKARRGELVLPAPTGYVWGEDGRLRVDPDQHVQQSIRLVFERFRLDGSARNVVRYFGRHGLQMPVRIPFTAELQWTPPRYFWVLSILHNPVYAGAYVYGKTEPRTKFADGRPRKTYGHHRAQPQWTVLLGDHHPAYVSWEEFMSNQEKLRSNRPAGHTERPDCPGAAREGEALLQGLVLCGRCGLRMYSRYYGGPARVSRSIYECRKAGIKDGTMSRCWSVSAKAVDEAVANMFLSVIQPAEIDLSLAVTRDVERQAEEIRRQWQLRLESARYDARLAERRYKAIDPENRTVARTLEREWNEKLEELAQLEREYESVRHREKVDLSDEDLRQILALARDVPKVWNAPTTTLAERKNLLRMLIREVALSPVDVPKRMTRIQVLWATGASSEIEVARPAPGDRSRLPEASLEALRRLYLEARTDVQIAEEMNRLKLAPRRGEKWTASIVLRIRKDNGLSKKSGSRPTRPTMLQREDGLYSALGVAKQLKITVPMVRSWIAKGHLTPAAHGQGRAWFRLTSKDIERLSQVRASLIARGYGPGGRQRHGKPILTEEVHCV